MIYNDILKGNFIKRPNRFIAHVLIDNVLEICHVKNTGRCAELLTPNAEVLVQRSHNPNRKTKFDLVAVYKDNMLINMDSQSPNHIFRQWVETAEMFNHVTFIKPEYTMGNSRLDFYMETENSKILAEVKGVTLEHNGLAMFPDAPTERGVKHLNHLAHHQTLDYDCYAVFIIQMENVTAFTPNYATHPEFAAALKQSIQQGVTPIILNCMVTYYPDNCSLEVVAKDHIPLILE